MSASSLHCDTRLTLMSQTMTKNAWLYHLKVFEHNRQFTHTLTSSPARRPGSPASEPRTLPTSSFWFILTFPGPWSAPMVRWSTDQGWCLTIVTLVTPLLIAGDVDATFTTEILMAREWRELQQLGALNCLTPSYFHERRKCGEWWEGDLISLTDGHWAEEDLEAWHKRALKENQATQYFSSRRGKSKVDLVWSNISPSRFNWKGIRSITIWFQFWSFSGT